MPHQTQSRQNLTKGQRSGYLLIHTTQPKEIHAVGVGFKERELLFQLEASNVKILCGNVSIVIDEFHNKDGTVTLGIRRFDSEKGLYRFIRKIPVKLSASEKAAEVRNMELEA